MPESGGTLSAGSYYLNGDVTLTTNITISDTVTLCLNGHILTGVGSGSVINVGNGATLTLCDCSTSETAHAQHSYYVDEDGLYVFYEGELPEGATEENTGAITGGVITGGGNVVRGGGVSVTGTFTMADGTIAGNTSSYGGGVYVSGNSSSFTMNGGIIAGNKASSNGGGVYAEGGAKFTMSSGTLADNTSSDHGGGVFVSSGSSFTMSGDASISGNTATNRGGGVYVNGEGAFFTMNGGTISDNTATNRGGGVYVYSGGTFEMTDGKISGNKATGDGGGGAYLDSTGASFTMSGGEISGNTATNGSGVYVRECSFTLSGGTLSGVISVQNDNYSITVTGGTLSEEAYQSLNALRNVDFDPPEGMEFVNMDGKYVLHEFHKHDGSEEGYSALTASNTTLSGGCYYLFDDLQLTTSNLTVTGDVTLCLNGHVLTGVGNSSVIAVSEGANFTLCDCSNAEAVYAQHSYYVDENGLYVFDNGTEEWDTAYTSAGADKQGTITGGVITGGTGSGVSASGTFTMEGGTIAGNTSWAGGGVNASGTFTMNGGMIAGNTVAGILGGGVSAGTFIMNGGTISANSASRGGGVNASVTFTMNGGEISGNKATGDGGGGVYVEGGAKFTMSSGTIAGNTSTDHGAGVYVSSGSSFTMSGDASISGNTAANRGGGVYVNDEGAFFTMNGGTITGNTSNDRGGGVYVYKYGTFEMTDGEISGNKATSGGGAYLDSAGASFTMRGGTISGNTATNGSGVYVRDCSFTLNGGTFNDVISAQNDYSIDVNGGTFSEGAYQSIQSLKANVSEDAEFVIIDGEYVLLKFHKHDGSEEEYSALTSANTTLSAGYYYLYDDLQLTDSNLTITGNVTICLNGHVLTGNGEGSVITVNGGATLTLCDCKEETVSNNVNGTDYDSGVITGGDNVATGGGIYVNTNGMFNMNGGTIAGNTAMIDGGGVYVSGTFNMNGGTIAGNKATSDGGGVYVYSSTFNMYDGTITNNTAVNGGGVYVNIAGTFNMYGGTISENTVTGIGGGVYVTNNSPFNLYDGTISGNTASFGGGVFVNSGNSFTMSGGKITNNTATGNGGGGVHVENNSIFSISGEAEISGNTANFGGGVFVNSGTINVSGAPVITGNTAGGEASNLYLKAGIAINAGDSAANQIGDADIGITLADDYSGIFAYSAAQTSAFSSDQGGLVEWQVVSNGYKIYYEVEVSVSPEGAGTVSTLKIYYGETATYMTEANAGYQDEGVTATIGGTAVTTAGEVTWAEYLAAVQSGQPTLSVTFKPMTYTIIFTNLGSTSIDGITGGNNNGQLSGENFVLTYTYGNEQTLNAGGLSLTNFINTGFTYGENGFAPSPLAWSDSDIAAAAGESDTITLTAVWSLSTPSITVDDILEATYNGEDHKITATGSHEMGSGDVVITYEWKNEDGEVVSETDTLTVKDVADSGVYTVTVKADYTGTVEVEVTTATASEQVTVTITPKTVNVGWTVDGAAWIDSATYDGGDIVIAVATSDFIDGDEVSLVLKLGGEGSSAQQTICNAAGYDFTVGLSGGSSGNYVVAEDTAGNTFTINKATLSVTGEALTATYGDLLSGLKASGTATFGDTTVEGTFTWDSSYAEDATVGTVGLQTFYATFTPTSGNFNIVENVAIQVTVESASLKLGDIAAYGGTYDGTAHAALTKYSAETVDGSDPKWEFSLDGETYSETLPSLTDAGEYTIYYRATAANHETASGSVKVTIGRKAVSVPTFAGELTANGEEQTMQPEGFDGALMTISGNTFTEGGEYTATVTLKDTENYVWADGTDSAKTIAFTVANKPFTAWWIIPVVVVPVVAAAGVVAFILIRRRKRIGG